MNRNVKENMKKINKKKKCRRNQHSGVDLEAGHKRGHLISDSHSATGKVSMLRIIALWRLDLIHTHTPGHIHCYPRNGVTVKKVIIFLLISIIPQSKQKKETLEFHTEKQIAHWIIQFKFCSYLGFYRESHCFCRYNL